MPQWVPQNDGVYRFNSAPKGHGTLVLARQNYTDVPFGLTLLKDLGASRPIDYEWKITFNTQRNGQDLYYIRWAESPNIYLGWDSKGNQLGLTGNEPFSHFGFEIVHGPLACYNITIRIVRPDSDLVLDIERERFEPYAPVIAFPQNDGINQVWGPQLIRNN